MRDAKMLYKDRLNGLGCFSQCVTVFSLLVLCAWTSAIHAQTPSAAAQGSTGKAQEGFTPGAGMGVRFEGSSSDDGRVFDLATGVGYNFSHRFGMGLGVPFYFVSTPTSISSQNPQAVSGVGIGDLGVDFKGFFPGPIKYSPTLHFGIPTGDKSKGFSTGHATWNMTNHFERGFGLFTPFIDAGVGNTILETWQFKRPYVVFGYNAQFEAGTQVDVGPFSLSGSAYDVTPWGDQTVISRVFRCKAGTKCAPAAASPNPCPPRTTCAPTPKSTNRNGFLQSNVLSGAADLARDNGFNASVEVKPRPYLDLEFDYSRSVPLHLDTFTFGIGVDVRALLRQRPHY